MGCAEYHSGEDTIHLLVGDCYCVLCCRVTEKEELNKMSVLNLASIFGPILMQLDNVRSDDTQHTLLHWMIVVAFPLRCQ